MHVGSSLLGGPSAYRSTCYVSIVGVVACRLEDFNVPLCAFEHSLSLKRRVRAQHARIMFCETKWHARIMFGETK